MKLLKNAFPLILLGTIPMMFISCGDDAGPGKDGSVNVSKTIIVDELGERPFIITAEGITADITIISGGGGGAGGVDYNGGGTHSTGGGGGGGASQVLELKGVTLETGGSYTAYVGDGGKGGIAGKPGEDGEESYIELNGVKVHFAAAGSGGKSNSIESKEGGEGGNGDPAGTKGGDGEDIGTNRMAAAGAGGTGGDNGSGYGQGGDGGLGTGIQSNNPVIASPGTKGTKGYIKIVWTGRE